MLCHGCTNDVHHNFRQKTGFSQVCYMHLRLRQLYTHGNGFLLILSYEASCVQNLKSVHPLIEKIHVHVSKCEYSL